MHRRSYSEDPALLERVFQLLEGCFPGLGAHAGKVIVPGDRWQDRSTPFVDEEGGELVGHVGLLELPAVLDGREMLLGGVHAVCVRAGRRKEGRCRRLMESVIEYCEGRYEALELHTDEPGIYERYGFRVVPEHAFEIEVAGPTIATGGPAGGLIPVDLRDPVEQLALARCLHDRLPVSRVSGSVREACIALFNLVGLGQSGLFGESGAATAPGDAGERPEPNDPDASKTHDRVLEGVYRLNGLDAYVALRIEGTTLVLLDVIAKKPVNLDEILERMAGKAPIRPGEAIRTVRTFFNPDLLGASGRPVPSRIKGDLLMVRGPFPPEGRPFIMPYTTHH